MPAHHEESPTGHFQTWRYSAYMAAFAAVLALATAGPVFSQTASEDGDTEKSPTAPVAYVYVGTSHGINLYDAASDGKLTLVSGSPYQTSGEMIGSNGKYFITLGTNNVHSYAVAADGAIKEQVSTIDTADYHGADCGAPYGTSGAVLDHSGRYLYVLLDLAYDNGSKIAGKYNYGAYKYNMESTVVCVGYQTFDIAKSSGVLTFNGAAITNNGAFPDCCTVPTITGNDKFGYALVTPSAFYLGSFIGLSRESDGTLENLSFNETGPTPQPGNVWYPMADTGDPSNHLAVALVSYNYSTNISEPIQLASYTVNGSGDIVSSNTWEDTPKLKGGIASQNFPGLPILNMSPSGKLLAVSGKPYGLQIFHFNGASPITAYSGVLTKADISRILWDNNNHLYALSDSTNKLYIYTITPTSISEAPGSPYTILSPNGLAVVPVL